MAAYTTIDNSEAAFQAFTYTGFDVKFRGWFSPTVPPAIWTDAA